MARVMSAFLGVAFIAIGLLGITGLLTLIKIDLGYAYLIEIIIGGLGPCGRYLSPGRQRFFSAEKAK